MKTEMKMLPNGNYEAVICPIQHRCYSEDHMWSCTQYSWKMENFELAVEYGDPCEDGWSAEIKVKHCPFCGYKIETD